MADNQTQYKEIALNGRWRPADDPAAIGQNDFAVMTNLRYGPTNPEGVGGQTKINTAVLPTTGIKTGIHFRKDRPAESHVVVHTPSDGKLWKNDTAIPSAGPFAGVPTAIFTGSTGHGNGRLSLTPNGGLAFCNGVDSVFWGGDEYPSSGFIDYPTTAQIYDYTDLVANTKADAANVATLHTAQGLIDANTMLLLSLNNNVTDTSPTTPHTVTNNNVTFSTSVKKFGTHSAYWNGTNAYLSIPDDADFNFSGGTWTVEGWFYPTDFTAQRSIYYQQTDANNYFHIRFAALGGGSVSDAYSGVSLSIYAASSEVVQLYTGNYTVPRNQWSHIAVVENGDNYYIFVNGALAASKTDTDRPANYTGTVQIGYSGTLYYMGYGDELRISNSARWTSNFSVPVGPYGADYVSTSYIGSIMPLDGAKLYVATANTQTATMAMNEWNGTSWAALAITDNTAVAGKTLAQTGTVTWATTASTSKTKFVEKRFLYWYQMVITSAANFAGTTLSRVNVSIPPQQIRDLWDGTDVPCLAFLGNKSGSFEDGTINVSRNEYDASNAGSYFKIVSYTSTDYILAGFFDQVSGIRVNIVDAFGNTTDIVATVSYHGSTAVATAPAWTGLTINDDTLNVTKSFNKSGYIYWSPPTKVQEFTQSVYASHTELTSSASVPIYYYKIAFSGTTSADVRIYYVSGIPVQTDIRGYTLPTMFQNRLALIGNADGKKNSALLSATNTVNVFNGANTHEFEFGDDKALVASGTLFTRFGSILSEQWTVCKNSETWVVTGIGSDTDPYVQRKISDTIGCTAPYTMASVPLGMEDKLTGTLRTALVWQSSDGIYMFDGASAPVKISRDIRHFFDPRRTEYLTAAMLSACYGSYDPVYNAYVWIVPDAYEYHFSLEERKWYRVDRGTGKYLNCAFPVQDTNGQYYNYGCSNAGYLYRLENGTTFDTTAIVHTLTLSDAALLEGRVSQRTEVRSIRLIGKAKATSSSVAVSHYGDSSTTASVPAIAAMSMVNSGKRLFNVFRSFGNVPLAHVFHTFKFVVSTTDETKGFEPMYAVVGFKSLGPDVR